MSIKSVAIEGDGIAAWCCARLLADRGIAVSIQRREARRRPWILISDPVQKLICEIAHDPDLFRDAPQIRRRHVLWGADPATFDHSSAIVEEQTFLNRLWTDFPSADNPPEWTIRAASDSDRVTHLGTRVARIAKVESRDAQEACWIEALPEGWLFLIPESLIAVGAPPEELLASSRLIAPHVDSLSDISPPVPVYPRIAQTMFGDRWLACGSAAMALDPICGDGSGHAVREAILAAAVLRGGATTEMLEHYQARLRIAFERHVSLCRSYYVSGKAGPWWNGEIAELDRMPAAPAPSWKFRLDGLDLIRL